MIDGQLNQSERNILVSYLLDSQKRPAVAIEVGTWLGGGSTLHILQAFQKQGSGRLWGIEADRSIYDRMTANIQTALPESGQFFTPLFGFSHDVIPKWIEEQGPDLEIDFVFLDGGDNPMEQVDEFHLLDKYIPVGGRLLSHDAHIRKGKWLVPYISALDNWKVEVHNVSEEGILTAKKSAKHASIQSKENARKVLVAKQREWIEVLGRMLPRFIKHSAIAILPKRLVRRLAEGRK